MTSPFVERLRALPRLGVGISTEFGASSVGVRPIEVRDVAEFLEIGVDLERGLDEDAKAWVARGWPTTWHFLDVNLEEPEDLDPDWLRGTVEGARAAGAAWICGDAGLWHVGPRDRGHGTLLAPILCDASVASMAEAVRRLRETAGLEVLPENPPAQVLVGDLHPLEYFGRLAERADCGLLLDVSHLAIVQRALRLAPDTLLDAFPVERVVELHIAGGRAFSAGTRTLYDDDHGPDVVEEVWRILDRLVPRLTALRAVVVECERNRPAEVRRLFAEVRAALAGAPGLRGETPIPPPVIELPSRFPAVDHRRLQRRLFRMLLDPTFRADHAWLTALEPDLVAADPGGRRRDQLLGNVALELLHTVRAAPDFLGGFPSSPEFHGAIDRDEPLVLALAAFADRVLPDGPWRELLALDTAMAELRRRRGPAPPARRVGLSPGARLVELAAGTVAAAGAIRDGARPGPLGPGRETVLLIARGRDVSVEVLADAVADLLRSCPLDDAAVDSFAARHGADRADADALVTDLVRDGALVIGN